MNSPAAKPFAPSTQPALELIALAQLSPDLARQRLRSLLLANPNYFGRVPSTSFNAVLNIQEDTAYESIAHLGFYPGFEQLFAAIDLKQPTGYSSEVLAQGSEEFVRFYLSYDGGSTWLDQGMRSVFVSDAHWPRPLAYEVTLRIIPADELFSAKIQPKIRAILSWNAPPPTGAPNWKPVWGHVAEIDVQIEDSQVIVTGGLNRAANGELPESVVDGAPLQMPMEFASSRTQGHLSMHALHSTRTDPHHRFLAYVLAKAAGICPSGSPDPRFGGRDPFSSGVSSAFAIAVYADPALAAI